MSSDSRQPKQFNQAPPRTLERRFKIASKSTSAPTPQRDLSSMDDLANQFSQVRRTDCFHAEEHLKDLFTIETSNLLVAYILYSML